MSITKHELAAKRARTEEILRQFFDACSVTISFEDGFTPEMRKDAIQSALSRKTAIQFAMNDVFSDCIIHQREREKQSPPIYSLLVSNIGWVVSPLQCKTDQAEVKALYDAYVAEGKHTQVSLWSDQQDDPLEVYDEDAEDDAADDEDDDDDIPVANETTP